jgi:hypothetical protein
LIYQVKRKDLIKLINIKASGLGLPRVKIKNGGSHDKLIILNVRVPIPRHKEISTGTARAIMESFEPLLGENWWKVD